MVLAYNGTKDRQKILSTNDSQSLPGVEFVTKILSSALFSDILLIAGPENKPCVPKAVTLYTSYYFGLYTNIQRYSFL